MAMKTQHKDKINYRFLLNCLAALTAAALFTAAITAAAILKYGAAATASITATSTLALTPTLPFVFGGLALICLLAVLFKGNNNGSTAVYTVRGNTGYGSAPIYSGSNFYDPTIFSPTRIDVYSRGAPNMPGGTTHGHGSTTHTHGPIVHGHR